MSKKEARVPTKQIRRANFEILRVEPPEATTGNILE